MGSRRPSFFRKSSKTPSAAVDAEQLRSSLKKEDTKERAPNDRKVCFSNLEILEFLIALGDNPSCEGAPLCMSDECQKERTIDVDVFEATRKDRRHRKQLVISATKRSRLLMSLGYSMEDIACAALETQKARQEREESLDAKKWDRFHLVAESARRKIKKVIGANKPQSAKTQVASRMA